MVAHTAQAALAVHQLRLRSVINQTLQLVILHYQAVPQHKDQILHQMDTFVSIQH
jgi:hypothetical protein